MTRDGWPERIGGVIPRLVTAFYDWDTRRIERGTERSRREWERLLRKWHRQHPGETLTLIVGRRGYAARVSALRAEIAREEQSERF